MFRVLLSCIIGYILGYERKQHHKNGGSRTLAIVCMSACLVAILTEKICLLGPETHNFTRLMAYTVAGISFIGNGVIIKNRGSVEGLTTAASLLACVVIGFFIGLSFYAYAVFSATLLYILLDMKYWKDLNGS